VIYWYKLKRGEDRLICPSVYMGDIPAFTQ
jgi:hypothetical protein